MTRRRSKLRIFGIILTSLILVTSVLYTSLLIVSSSKLQTQMKAGHILTVQDIENEQVPDHENAAVVYRQIFKVIKDPAVHSDTTFLTNRFLSDERDKDPTIWDKARKSAKNTEAIINLAEHAVSRPKCRLSYDYKNYFAGFIEEGAYLREISRILHANTILAASDGDIDKACHLVSLNFKLAGSLGNERTLMSNMVMNALIQSPPKDYGRQPHMETSQQIRPGNWTECYPA